MHKYIFAPPVASIVSGTATLYPHTLRKIIWRRELMRSWFSRPTSPDEGEGQQDSSYRLRSFGVGKDVNGTGVGTPLFWTAEKSHVRVGGGCRTKRKETTYSSRRWGVLLSPLPPKFRVVAPVNKLCRRIPVVTSGVGSRALDSAHAVFSSLAATVKYLAIHVTGIIVIQSFDIVKSSKNTIQQHRVACQ